MAGIIDCGFGISKARISTLNLMLLQKAVVWDEAGTQGLTAGHFARTGEDIDLISKR